MAELETQIHRLPNLKKWFVEISVIETENFVKG